MDSSAFEGFVLDPSKCSKLSMKEKREIVYEVSEWSHGAPELLQSWSRQEILQILCAEMGKERKYTGLTKLKIIEHLLKIVAEKRSQDNDIMMNLESSDSDHPRSAKRHRKSDHPNRLNVASEDTYADLDDSNVEFCKNSACRAKLSQDGGFCKRCSCCICHQYDDNKDPSLWLICSSDPPFNGNSCGMTCHLECALKHEKSGIPKDERNRGLDGSFYCVSCGKLNDLLGCWRKQMTIARDTRRVDILCYRVSLSQKLLAGTLRYQKLHQTVNEAMEKLEADVGPLTGLPVKRARGIVNRLSSGQEVQKLCAFAVESLDSLLSNMTFSDATDPSILTPIVKFGNIFPTSISVILGSRDQPIMDNARTHRYIMWHRKAEETDYPAKPTCTLFAPTCSKFLLSGLTPSTQYVLKVVHFENTCELGIKEMPFQTGNDDGKSPPTNSSSLSNPSSVEDENTNIVNKQKDKEVATNTDAVNISKNCSINDENNEKDSDPFAPATSAKLPITPCKTERVKDSILPRKTQPKSLKKKVDNGSEDEPDESDDRDFGYYVKVIRWLECEGHIDTGFRKKFLTWYSLRASQQEVRIVKVFVDTLMEDPASLAGQLVDTFSDVITNKTCSSTGLCLKLFH
ncbi:hypothetical protein SSX86_005140 [Deinandra increscens subsp. villosa]|uniref:Fibronectin type-III domain-containing protein n=1 Tax=Deinandra increscens subsp. villosa TaxID=3103831 RepID=A0AAP0DLE7_9ASTR